MAPTTRSEGIEPLHPFSKPFKVNTNASIKKNCKRKSCKEVVGSSLLISPKLPVVQSVMIVPCLICKVTVPPFYKARKVTMSIPSEHAAAMPATSKHGGLMSMPGLVSLLSVAYVFLMHS